MKRKGFTLIELLVVVAIIALLISILLPSLSRAQEQARRATCAANLSGIGKSAYIYSNDNRDSFPIHYYQTTGATTTGAPGQNGVQWFKKIGFSASMPSGPLGTSTNATLATQTHASRSLFLLIINGDSAPKQFICASAGDTEDDLRNGTGSNLQTAQPGINRFDFKGWNTLSYGYQIPFGPKGQPRNNRDSRMPLAADKGPYFQAGATANAQLTGGFPDDTSGLEMDDPTTFANASTEEALLRLSNDQWRLYNSRNHGNDGQNVLFVDGHAEFVRKPIVGVANDNIYTAQTALNNPVKVMLGQMSGDSANGLGPSTNTDSVIIP